MNDARDETGAYQCQSCGSTRGAISVSWWTDCDQCGSSDWVKA